jgi:hypothetical protein
MVAGSVDRNSGNDRFAHSETPSRPRRPGVLLRDRIDQDEERGRAGPGGTCESDLAFRRTPL